MTISRTTQAHLAKGDFDAIESEWLGRLGESPDDLDHFVGVARALVGNGQDGRARTLLEMLDEHLKERELWAVRRKLLERAGTLLLQPDKVHPTLLATLKRLYGHRPSFVGLVEAVGLHRAPQDIPKTWEKVERLETLLAFDIGTVVAMEGKGVGRVVEANMGLESFKIDFERIKGMNVGFKAAGKLLRSLAPGHVLRRKLEEPDVLKKMAKEKPSDLLHAVLESFGRPLTAGEVRDAVAGIVTESGWTSFWSAARKHPQVLAAGTGSRQTYSWAESSGDALIEVWKVFSTASPRRKIELLRKNSTRDSELVQRMADDMAKIAAASFQSDPGLVWEIWFSLERGPGAPADAPWGPEALLAQIEPRRLAGGIEDRLLRERAYVMWRERREDWPAIFREAFPLEQDPRALDLLAEGILTATPKEHDRIVDSLLAQPHRHPAGFTWLVERAANDEALRTRNPLRLLQQLVTALSRDEFIPFRLRLLALAESGGTAPRLLAHLTEEQAPLAREAVDRAASLEPYQREALIAALELRFPRLRQPADTVPLYALRSSIDQKRQELQTLLVVDIPANRKAIEEARAMGDLRENFEYKSARQRHEYLNARASGLNADLSRVRPIDPPGDFAEARIGTRLVLGAAPGQTGGDRTLTLLGPWESQPENDIISYESDLGRGLLGAPVGTEVEVSGGRYIIRAIENAVEASDTAS